MSRQVISVLQGKRILVTRTREQASAFSERLQALGAQPIEFPTIRIVPPPDWNELDRALLQLVQDENGYSWVVFTSANGVTISLKRLLDLGYSPHKILQHTRVATIGPATAATLATYGIQASLIPDAYRAESVAAGLIEDARQKGTSLVGQKILLARAAEARKVLVSDLQQAGALVDEVAAYYTETVPRDDTQGREILRLLQDEQLAILTFTSSSTVRNFMAWFTSCEQDEGRALIELITPPSGAKVACIGPITAQTARTFGLHVDIEASEFTIAGLTEAIVHYYKEQNHD